jgi:predicted ester cyclase
MKKLCSACLAVLISGSISCRPATSCNKGRSNTIPGSHISHADISHWISAWNSHNIDSIDALFAEHALIYQPQNPRPLTKGTMNPFFEMVFKTYPDIRFESLAIIVEGNEAVSWERVSGTMLGTFTEPATGQILQPNHKRFNYEVAKRLVYDANHKIKELHIILDEQILARQLGLQLK